MSGPAALEVQAPVLIRTERGPTRSPSQPPGSAKKNDPAAVTDCDGGGRAAGDSESPLRPIGSLSSTVRVEKWMAYLNRSLSLSIRLLICFPCLSSSSCPALSILSVLPLPHSAAAISSSPPTLCMNK